MRRPGLIETELQQVETVHSLTAVFENIASLRIGRIKDQVLASNDFFSELWQLYSQLRIKTSTPALAALAARRSLNKTVFVLITSEGGLSGDIDRRIIDAMKADYHPDNVDIVAIGYHGVGLLAQEGIKLKRFFRLPTSDAPIDVTPVIAAIAPYKNADIYYQKFVSLARQKVDKIALMSAVRTMGSKTGNQQTITAQEFLFEPSIEDVVVYLERVMMEIALAQTILDSRLSQLASRFNAMRQAQDRAQELAGDLQRLYFSAKRSRQDERIREVFAAMGSRS